MTARPGGMAMGTTTLAKGARRAALAALLLGAGCTYVKPFTYKPTGAATPGPAVPAKLAVLPFEDATEDYVQKGGMLTPESLWFNLVRGGIPATIEPVTAPLWAQAFARELEASGRYRAVRFCVETSEVVDEDYVVTGAVTRADTAGSWDNVSQYEFRAAATRRKDGRKVWERTVARSVKGDRKAYDGCGDFGITCMVDRSHDGLRTMFAEMFEEAGADLARALGGKPAAGAPAPGAKPAAEKPGEAEPVDETIRKILEGK